MCTHCTWVFKIAIVPNSNSNLISMVSSQVLYCPGGTRRSSKKIVFVCNDALDLENVIGTLDMADLSKSWFWGCEAGRKLKGATSNIGIWDMQQVHIKLGFRWFVNYTLYIFILKTYVLGSSSAWCYVCKEI